MRQEHRRLAGWAALALLVGALAVVAAGCGGSSGGGGGGDEGTASTEIEGLGVQLFSRIEGSHVTIMGLPLLPLLDYLRMRGLMKN